MLPFAIRYRKAMIGYFFTEELPRKLAYLVPRKVALYCFIRVYCNLDSPGPEYKDAYNMWEAGMGR